MFFLKKVSQSSIARTLVKGTFWHVLGQVLSKVSTMIALVIVARVLGKDAFGEFSWIRGFVFTFVSVSSCSIGASASKYISEYLPTDKERVGRIIALCYLFVFVSALGVSLFFFGVGPLICENMLGMPQLIQCFHLGAFALFLYTVMLMQQGVMMGFQDFKGLAASYFIAGVIAIPFYACGSYWGGVQGAIWGIVVVALFNIPINSLLIYLNTRRHGIKYSFREAGKEISILWHFNLPAFLFTVLFGVVFWGIQVLIAYRTGNMGDLGIFNAIASLQTVLLFIPMTLNAVFLPMLSCIKGKKDVVQFNKVFATHAVVNLLASLAVAVPMAIFSKQCLFLFGGDFVEGWPVLVVFCLTMIPYALGDSISLALISSGKVWVQTGCMFLWGTVYFVLSYVALLNGYGVFGVAVAYFVSYTVLLLLFIGAYMFHRDHWMPALENSTTMNTPSPVYGAETNTAD